MSKENKGKGCMICMNVLLLILGSLLIAGAAYLLAGKELPPGIEAFTQYAIYAIVAGVGLIIFAILGICASCGGCILYIYAIVITLVTIVCFVIDIVLFAAFFTIKPEKEDGIVKQIDNITLTMVNDPEWAEDWLIVQDAFTCCGYKGEGQTGNACTPATIAPGATPSPIVDCRTLFIEVISDYSLYASLLVLVIFLVLLILTCASCKAWKEDDCCKC